MKSLFSLIVLPLFGLCLLGDEPKCDDSQGKAVEQALESFVGTWRIVTAQPTGVTKDAEKLVFRKDGTYAALDKKDHELWAGTYDIDPTAKPKIWDHRSIDAQKSGGDVLGIYELDGNNLNVSCVVGTWKEKQWTGKPRPTAFTLPTADAVLELRRVTTTGKE
ncbi:TIGR03067 domain-containing protein [Schlesneria paludicola]|uniref:TIGR03067 domain-containing protein n=1 Tax=Schlesneria paludicola TaxID=360056 RepID=UPI0002E822F9|nr:TIGR03067 domain-containing protein [Schlesneria paludicola]